MFLFLLEGIMEFEKQCIRFSCIYAIQAGMNMGIVNPALLEVYDDIPKDLLEHVEDVILDRREDATERLLDFAETCKRFKKRKKSGFILERKSIARQNYTCFSKRN